MNLPNINIDNIEEIKVIESYISIDDLEEENVNERSLVLNVGIADWKEEINRIPEISDGYDDFDEAIYLAVAHIEGLEAIDYGFNYEFTFEMDYDDTKLEAIEAMFENLNNEIKNIVEEKLGVNFEKYYELKNEEKHNDMEADYENIIRKLSYQKLNQELGEHDLDILLKSNAIPSFNFNMRDGEYKSNDSKNYKLPRVRQNSNKKEREIYSKEYDEIISSEFIESIKQIQINNISFVNIIATDEAKDLVKKILIESTEDFYNNPRYYIGQNPEISKFLGRVNNNKGKDADVYVNNDTDEIQLVTGNHITMSQEDLNSSENSILLNRAERVVNEYKSKKLISSFGLDENTPKKPKNRPTNKF